MDKKRLLRKLGKAFSDWHLTGRVRFEYAMGNSDLGKEIDRVSELIKYVITKREKLSRDLYST